MSHSKIFTNFESEDTIAETEEHMLDDLVQSMLGVETSASAYFEDVKDLFNASAPEGFEIGEVDADDKSDQGAYSSLYQELFNNDDGNDPKLH